jgi:hypothetical protein
MELRSGRYGGNECSPGRGKAPKACMPVTDSILVINLPSLLAEGVLVQIF